jgi:hypothetical protein
MGGFNYLILFVYSEITPSEEWAMMGPQATFAGGKRQD